MKKNIPLLLFQSVTLTLLVIAFSNQLFNIPPLGKFLNPFSGAVQNENCPDKNTALKLDGLQQPVQISFDKRDVAHIFAQNENDLYLAQGYVTASARLWQMDFITYASAGRLSELFGPSYLEYDRLQRRMGIGESAKKSLELIEKDSETKQALDAYTKGVNDYISSLDEASFPYEYKLMDYKPEAWTNLKSVLIMKYMSSMLTGYEEDVSMSHMLLALGEKEFRKVYPEVGLPDNDSVFGKIFLPDSLPYASYINYSFLTSHAKINKSFYNPKLGSNNWALSGKKTSSGNTILCNDPHLNLSLPSIWYEIQLSCGDLNVYGVSIPGTVGVIIGFNQSIAWGMTNGATDVRDWYKLKLKSDYSAYLFDEKWVPTTMRTDSFLVRGQQVFVDTVYSTIQGPVVIDSRFKVSPDVKDMALKWTLHEPSNEFRAFIDLAHAKSYPEFQKAISNYLCPSQNFIYADNSGNIAIQHQGLFYKKWNGQGRFVLDGSRSSHLYSARIPDSELPSQLNPQSGFVYSANNAPLFDTMPGYMNGYYSELRAKRIQDLLSVNKKFSVADMKKMQTDNTNEIAALSLDLLLKSLEKSADKISSREKKTIGELVSWDKQYSAGSTNAVFFEHWWNYLEDMTWDELHVQDFYLRPPDDAVLIRLLAQEQHSHYFDCMDTKQTENADTLILRSFRKAMNDSISSNWGEQNTVQIQHLSKLEALSINQIHSSGYPEALNAVSANWGPSWRMIVELGKRPEAYGVIAGGQSGNPASPSYSQSVKAWSEGNYFKLNYFFSAAEAGKDESYHWTLEKK